MAHTRLEREEGVGVTEVLRLVAQLLEQRLQLAERIELVLLLDLLGFDLLDRDALERDQLRDDGLGVDTRTKATESNSG